ncbi:MAG: hypothetical protein VB118_03025 [Oscillospiraceae bacterium]|nr:hypothetical protein [Oscillospiraceae bacterium]
MAKDTDKVENAEKVEQTFEIKFSKKQIASSKRYKDRIDLVNALLDDDKEYSLAEVDETIETYLKGKVN